MKKLLFINHSSSTGGAQRSLYEYLKLINKDKKNEIYLLSPSSDNELLKEFRTINFRFIPQFYNGIKSYYRGYRWFLLIREFTYFLLFFIFCIYLKVTYKKFDLIYFNDITLLPCLILKFFFKSKYVSALRSKQRLKKNFVYKYLKKLCDKYLFKIISIDNDIFNSSYSINKTIICRNIFKFNKKYKKKVKDNNFIVGYIGTFLKEKGIENFYNVAKIFSKKKYNKFKIKFYAIGKIPDKNLKFYLSSLLQNPYFIPNDQLGNFYLLGDTNKLDSVYNKVDLMTFISKVKAIGRPVLEASFFNVPSIVYLNEKKSDYIINNFTGYIIEEGNINEVVKKIIYLYKRRDLLSKFGHNAYKNSLKKFDPKSNFLRFRREILDKI